MAKQILTKAQAIEKLLEDVSNWDIDNLVDYVTYDLEMRYNEMSSQEIENEYNTMFNICDDEELTPQIQIAENTKAGKILYGDK